MERDKHGAIVNSDGSTYWPGSTNPGKRDGLTEQEKSERRRMEMEMRTHSVSDVRADRTPFMTTRQRLRARGQRRSPSASAEVKAFRAVGSSNPGIQAIMAPPMSPRMSKAPYRKEIKRFFRKQREKAQTDLQDAMKEAS